MSIIFNGTELSYNATIKYNSTELTSIVFNGTGVWKKDSSIPSLTIDTWSASASQPSYTESGTVTISGSVSDAESGLASLTVNGNAVAVSNNRYSTTVSLSGNTTNTITVVAKDNAGNVTTKYAYIYYIYVPTGTNLANFYKTDGIASGTHDVNVSLDNTAAFSKNGNVLTCKVAGTYYLVYKAFCSDSSGMSYSIKKNGVQVEGQTIVGTIEKESARFTLAVSDTLQVATGSYYNYQPAYAQFMYGYVRKV